MKSTSILALTLMASTSMILCMQHEAALQQIDNKLVSIAPTNQIRDHIIAISVLPKLESTDKEGNTRLHWAAYLQDKPLVEALLKLGANPNARNNAQATPLHLAAQTFKNITSKDIIDALIQAGASPDNADIDMRTPIHILIHDYLTNHTNQTYSFATVTALEPLLTHAKNKDPQDLRGNTPLYLLVTGLKTTNPNDLTYKVVVMLLNTKANPNIQNKDGFTPLHAAVANQNLALVKLLLKYDANPLIKTFVPRTMKEIQAKVVPKSDKTARDIALHIKEGIAIPGRKVILEIEIALLEAEQGIPAQLQPAPTQPEPVTPEQEQPHFDLEVTLQDLARQLQELKNTLF